MRKKSQKIYSLEDQVAQYCLQNFLSNGKADFLPFTTLIFLFLDLFISSDVGTLHTLA